METLRFALALALSIAVTTTSSILFMLVALNRLPQMGPFDCYLPLSRFNSLQH